MDNQTGKPHETKESGKIIFYDTQGNMKMIQAVSVPSDLNLLLNQLRVMAKYADDLSAIQVLYHIKIKRR